MRELQQRVALLELPETCKNGVSIKAELIGEQVIEIEGLLPDKFYCVNQTKWHFMKAKLHWTWEGTIDKKSTAEAFVDSTDLNAKERFQVAIKFCLEDRINSLSIHMPTNYLQHWLYEGQPLPLIAAMDDTSIARRHFRLEQLRSDCIHYFQNRYSNLFEILLNEKIYPASCFY